MNLTIDEGTLARAVARALAECGVGGQAGDVEYYRRGGSPMSWSTAQPIIIPSRENNALNPTVQRSVLKMEGGFVPRVWQVVMQSTGADQVPGAMSFEQSARVKYYVGNVARTADFDLAAGGACFPITADAIELFGINNSLSLPFQLEAAIAPHSGEADYRAPRRTVRAPFVTATPGSILVPPFAQRLCILRIGTALQFFTWRDAFGGNVGEFNIQNSALQAPYYLEVPSSAASLEWAAVVGGNHIQDFIFLLGL